ncbi:MULTISPECIES: ABC transporter permease subunit [unclassified Paenibacillus]|uniref:ABC transporter permease n=1 Tax=unclassified Paenibacillus TaxID=185978 RepID=UPI0010E4250B|nr:MULTISPECIES: ABC transporter permease subunit [unclassified Paenibacillus]NIK69606.1 putative aldouronate transport system permease protein [Paenibacillus sp. BK720]TCM95782.1 putative aldouronate transport system permease protein [Paenibacillus sp. BK033]
MKQLWLYFLRNWQLYVLLLGPVAYFLVFKYGPMYGILIAFQDFNLFKGVMGSPWVGFDVFREVFGMSAFYKALRNTFMLNLTDLLFSFPAPILLALLLNELSRARFKKWAQTILYLPHFLSWVIIGGIMLQVFATNTGIVNLLLGHLGIDPIPFLTNKYNWLITYLVVGVWQSAGWGTIVYLAAITGINSELYEAAAVDGAGRFRKMWSVTLPGIRPTVVVLLILKIGEIVQISFDRPYVIGNVSVLDFSEVISTFVYKTGVQTADFSLATAVGLFQAVVGIILLLAANRIAKKITGNGVF